METVPGVAVRRTEGGPSPASDFLTGAAPQVPRDSKPGDPALGVMLWGRHFANPLGLAAGFDKDAECMAGMLGMGFGFVEVGSVTPKPQPGNPTPRLFRLYCLDSPELAVINRYGFNSGGHDAALANVVQWRASGGRPPCPTCPEGKLGVNLGRNKTSPVRPPPPGARNPSSRRTPVLSR